jgi:hydroxypyruvate isomerase
MSTIKQCLAWWGFANRLGASTLIQQAVRIGFQGVEMAPTELWPQITDAGLRIVTIGGHQSLTSGLNRQENHDRIEREIEERLVLAQKWDIPHLIVFSGNREGLSDATGLENTVNGLRRVAGAAEDAGITLVLELLNSKINHPDYQADHTEWGKEVVQAVNSPRVKLLYDIYHMQVMEGDVIHTIQDNIDYIGHFHTAGVPGRHELDEDQELYYPAIMRAIAATDYDGYVGHEFTPRGEPIAGLEQAFKVCDV